MEENENEKENPSPLVLLTRSMAADPGRVSDAVA